MGGVPGYISKISGSGVDLALLTHATPMNANRAIWNAPQRHQHAQGSMSVSLCFWKERKKVAQKYLKSDSCVTFWLLFGYVWVTLMVSHCISCRWWCMHFYQSISTAEKHTVARVFPCLLSRKHLWISSSDLLRDLALNNSEDVGWNFSGLVFPPKSWILDNLGQIQSTFRSNIEQFREAHFCNLSDLKKYNKSPQIAGAYFLTFRIDGNFPPPPKNLYHPPLGCAKQVHCQIGVLTVSRNGACLSPKQSLLADFWPLSCRTEFVSK